MDFTKPQLPAKALVLIALALGTIIGQSIPLRVQAALIIISAPLSVLPGAIQSQTNASIFYESTTTLTAPLSVDIIAPGTYNLADPDNPGSIGKGTTVTSYFLHHESVANQLSTVIVAGTFPNPILGVIVNGTFLDASDPILGNPGTLYPTGLNNRGLEIPYNALADVVFWSGNQVFISVKSTTADVLDQVRIITSAVPEPSTFVLAGIGGLGLLVCGARRRSSR
jgi:hypothetical protein